MTFGLSQISQALEARAFLRNQIEEWKKIANLTKSSYANAQLAELTKIDNNLLEIILGYEGKIG